QILANPFYQAVSSSFAGTQEYMAMEKLSQLRAQAEREGTWDLVIVDTPPSRSALDFLDAPKRLGSFLDGRFIRLLTAPARAGGRAYLKVFSVSATIAAATISKVLGGAFLSDVQTFVAALDTMFGGFRERADLTYALLKEPATAFVVVAAPERDALREAAYFVERLESEGMPLAGVVVNRMQALAAPALSGGRATAAAEQLEDQLSENQAFRGGPAAEPPEGAGRTPEVGRSPTQAVGGSPTLRVADLTPALLRLHADLCSVAERHEGHVRRFVAGHPGVPMATVAASATDIHDLEGLRTVGAALATSR
ncbi:MAG TPA: ArsA-related P-loop ATPase, partial [Ornithinibacter sp.]|nr:ArsA-related P-loop ATPase [Ornithinibacter sp.]